MSSLPGVFGAFFEQATGRAPYPYQRALAACEVLPAVLDVPTGAGKTQALLVSWLFQRRVEGRAPRRLVYALPMRTLVEQTARVAADVRSRLGLSDDELAIHKLMGGETPTDWREHPDRDQILVGTVDMLLSRALNRGYAESRFAWPVAFGLLNSGCRWVFDEVQLMGPARTTSAQLDGLRRVLGVAEPCETIWASATVDRDALITVDRPEIGTVLALDPEDRAGALERRLHARKTLERVQVHDLKALVAAVSSAHQARERTLVVLNTVARAQETALALRTLQPDVDVVLLHSRYRPSDRARQMDRALDTPRDEGAIVVATQVIEAGVDLSAAVLVTEAAPFSSIVQRLGRCNRSGEHDEARVLWVDTGEPTPKTTGPYLPDDLTATRAALAELVGTSLSPQALRGLEVPEHRQDPLVLRRRDLLDLFDTAPDLSGLDVDVAPFIRDADTRSVSVFFREELPSDAPAAGCDELVDVPIGELDKRERRVFDHIDRRWVSPPSRLRPGDVVMLAAADGGYDAQVGWRRGLKGTVAVLNPPSMVVPEGQDDDRLSVERHEWQLLRCHLEAARQEAEELVGGADIEVVRAAALHDIGKAHPSFQEMLLGTASDGVDRRGELWAKSAERGGRHRRPHFRHELASALALLQLGEDPLVCYLVAAHHGRVRLSIRPAPNEKVSEDGHRRALGVQDADGLPEVATPVGSVGPLTLTLDAMELGASPSWIALTHELRDRPDLGPFRLAYLEALVRIADWRASARA